MATCERLLAQLSLQAHFSSLALGFAQWSRKALQASSRLVCQNWPHLRQLNGRTMRLCAILRTPDPSTLAWSGVC